MIQKNNSESTILKRRQKIKKEERFAMQHSLQSYNKMTNHQQQFSNCVTGRVNDKNRSENKSYRKKIELLSYCKSTVSEI